MKNLDDILMLVAILLVIGTTFVLHVPTACYLTAIICAVASIFIAKSKDND